MKPRSLAGWSGLSRASTSLAVFRSQYLQQRARIRAKKLFEIVGRIGGDGVSINLQPPPIRPRPQHTNPAPFLPNESADRLPALPSPIPIGVQKFLRDIARAPVAPTPAGTPRAGLRAHTGHSI